MQIIRYVNGQKVPPSRLGQFTMAGEAVNRAVQAANSRAKDRGEGHQE